MPATVFGSDQENQQGLASSGSGGRSRSVSVGTPFKSYQSFLLSRQKQGQTQSGPGQLFQAALGITWPQPMSVSSGMNPAFSWGLQDRIQPWWMRGIIRG